MCPLALSYRYQNITKSSVQSLGCYRFAGHVLQCPLTTKHLFIFHTRIDVQLTTILAGSSLEATGVDPKIMKCVTKCVRDTSACIDSLKASLDSQMQEFSHLVRYLKGVKTTTTVRSLAGC